MGYGKQTNNIGRRTKPPPNTFSLFKWFSMLFACVSVSQLAVCICIHDSTQYKVMLTRLLFPYEFFILITFADSFTVLWRFFFTSFCVFFFNLYLRWMHDTLFLRATNEKWNIKKYYGNGRRRKKCVFLVTQRHKPCRQEKPRKAHQAKQQREG